MKIITGVFFTLAALFMVPGVNAKTPSETPHVTKLLIESVKKSTDPSVPTLTIPARVEHHKTHQFFWDLLALALQKTEQQYGRVNIEVSPISVPQNRALTLIRDNLVLDVYWSVSTKHREADVIPIKIPLLKGMMGQRVFLIMKEKQFLFSKQLKEQELQQLIAGQGHDWPDLDILLSNGYSATGSSNYSAIIKMLQMGRIDYFPRSVLEVINEQKDFEELGVVIESDLMLKYSSNIYYFVSKKRPELAVRVQEGLKIAMSDGSYEALYDEFVGSNELEKKLNLSNRKVFELENNQQ